MKKRDLAAKLRWRADNVRRHREEISGTPDGVYAEYEHELRQAAQIIDDLANVMLGSDEAVRKFFQRQEENS